jgi:hypothetical protein
MDKDFLIFGLGVVAGYVTNIVVAWVTHYLNISRDETKQRIDKQNKNIVQVQSYLNDYFDAANLMVDLETKVVSMNTIDGADKVLDRIDELINQTRKTMGYLPLLKDTELLNIEGEWFVTFWTEKRRLLDLISSVDASLAINQQVELNRISLFNKNIATLHGKMQQRLIELSRKVK